ncbi:MAG: tetratricopeptide repeat protein [Dehalococcoidia bacterium]
MEISPTVEYVVALGDVYAAAGREQDAEEQYELVDVIARLAEANGVDTDLEMALFKADHGRNLGDALAEARAVYARRPGVHTADVLAWTLYQSGEYDEASRMVQEALQLGTKDALILFHAGMIAHANSDYATALDLLQQAVDTNPHFSLLFAEMAQETLAQGRALTEGGTNG